MTATRTGAVFRFAPSPNGELHLGHAYSALLNQQMAASAGGALLLRIEDIDTTRCTPQFEAAIYRDLEWLRVRWQGPVRRQSEHFAEYGHLLDRLIADELVYPAFMSRGEARAWIAETEAGGRAWPRDPDGVPLYPGLDKTLAPRERSRRIAEGRAFAWRLDMRRAIAAAGAPLFWTEYPDSSMDGARQVRAQPELWGDVVLARREVATSYHLSVVADDALQGITHVVRGLDLFEATGIHRLLQQLLGLPEPSYFHHRLITGPDGRKLSKSLGDTGLAALREAGRTAQDIRVMVGLASDP
jgi:glutamyl-Q tRNA(Asp) synthetase